jgi:hypothetical protein
VKVFGSAPQVVRKSDESFSRFGTDMAQGKQLIHHFMASELPVIPWLIAQKL